MPVRVSVWAVGLLAAAGLCLPATIPPLGSGVAVAKESYTRKRVNGRWVTGRFGTNGGSTRAGLSRPDPEVPPSPPARSSAALGEAAPNRAIVASRSIPAAALPFVTASLASPAGETGLERMRPALEARAKTLAGVVSLPPPPPAAEPAGTAMKSLVLDFEKGTRTVVFNDDAVVTEPLDRDRARELAAASSR